MVSLNMKQAILNNKFLDRLRLLQVDESAYSQLSSDLRQLAIIWHDASEVDKELVAELYVIVQVTQNMAKTMLQHGDTNAERVRDMAHELDALVLECLT